MPGDNRLALLARIGSLYSKFSLPETVSAGSVTASEAASKSAVDQVNASINNLFSDLAPDPVTDAIASTFAGSDITTDQDLQGWGHSFADVTSDSLIVSTDAADAFVLTGTGNDVIQASGAGLNVLDDIGGQANFEIGTVEGNNAFFLDTSNESVSWNTISNLHSGDFAVIYGIAPQDLMSNARDSLGVIGYAGLTLETFQDGGAAFITLAGHSNSDVSTGLATSFGIADGKPFLLIAT